MIINSIFEFLGVLAVCFAAGGGCTLICYYHPTFGDELRHELRAVEAIRWEMRNNPLGALNVTMERAYSIWERYVKRGSRAGWAGFAAIACWGCWEFARLPIKNWSSFLEAFSYAAGLYASVLGFIYARSKVIDRLHECLLRIPEVLDRRAPPGAPEGEMKKYKNTIIMEADYYIRKGYICPF